MSKGKPKGKDCSKSKSKPWQQSSTACFRCGKEGHKSVDCVSSLEEVVQYREQNEQMLADLEQQMTQEYGDYGDETWWYDEGEYYGYGDDYTDSYYDEWTVASLEQVPDEEDDATDPEMPEIISSSGSEEEGTIHDDTDSEVPEGIYSSDSEDSESEDEDQARSSMSSRELDMWLRALGPCNVCTERTPFVCRNCGTTLCLREGCRVQHE